MAAAKALLKLCQHTTQVLQTHAEDDPIHECAATVALNKIARAPEEVVEMAERELNVFPFKDVGRRWFRLFVDGCLGMAGRVIRKGIEQVRVDEELETGAREERTQTAVGEKTREEVEEEAEGGLGWLDEVVRLLDRALIMAGGIGREELIHQLLAGLQDFEDESLRSSGEEIRDGRPRKRRKFASESPSRSLTAYPNNLQDEEEEQENDDDLLPLYAVAAPKIRYPVPRLNAPSLSAFQKHMDNVKEPVILTGIMDHWPALNQWKKRSYWMRETFNGRRLVPVEIGRSYMDDDWGQKIMPFREFLRRYILDEREEEEEGEEKEGEGWKLVGRSAAGADEGGRAENGNSDHAGSSTEKMTGYLAQHDLFSQIPSLRSTIAVPDYCYLDPPPPDPGTPVYLSRLKNKSKNNHPQIPKTLLQHQAKPETKSSHPTTLPSPRNLPSPLSAADTSQIQTNIWFGPPWTISPLHHDPYHNILCLVVGRKYIRLYAPGESGRLFPRGEAEVAPHVRGRGVDADGDGGVGGHGGEEEGNAADEKDSGDGILPEGGVLQPETSTKVQDHSPTPTTSPKNPLETHQKTKHEETIDMANTSSIDLSLIETSPHEDWDATYPGFSSVPYVECVLGAGEALYLPVGWWHYVRGCEVSVGVSCWWG